MSEYQVELKDGTIRSEYAHAFSVSDPGDLVFLNEDGVAIKCYAPGSWTCVELTSCD